MTRTVLGAKPGELEVNTTTGADYTVELTYKVNDVETDWPDGTVLTLVFTNRDGVTITTFTASIVGAVATFEEDKAVVENLPRACGAKLVYTNGATDRVLLAGRGYRHG